MPDGPLHKNQTGANLHVPGYQQSGDPGAVGAGKYWVDTTGGTGAWALKTRNAADSGWETLASGGGGPTEASTAEMETPTGSTQLVTPRRVQAHPGVAKAWVRFNGTGTVAIAASHGVSSITDNGTGDYTVNWTTSFSSASYHANITMSRTNSNTSLIPVPRIDAVNPPTASAFRFATGIPDGSRNFQAEDAEIIMVDAHGDQ